KISRSCKLPELLSKRWVLWLMAGLVFSCSAGSLLFLYEYGKYQEIVNARMRGPIFANTASIYAAPQVIRLGEQIGPREIVSALRRAGYTEAGGAIQSKTGTYRLHDNSLVVMPGPDSFYSPEGARILFARSTIIGISHLEAKTLEAKTD